jgi:hypothetical protein
VESGRGLTPFVSSLLPDWSVVYFDLTLTSVLSYSRSSLTDSE